MPLRSLIVIALRLYAIYWFTVSVGEFIIYLPTVLALGTNISRSFNPAFYLAVPGLIFVMAALMWLLAVKLSGPIVKGQETQLVFTTLTRHDFYLFSFVFLGIYFAVSSIAATIRAAFDFYRFELLLPESDRHGQYLIPLVGHVFTIGAGLACIFGARKWTHQLIALDNKYADTLEATPAKSPSMDDPSS